MIELTNTKVLGFEDAIRGMRNPMNSWDKSDSRYECVDYSATKEMDIYDFVIGPKDLINRADIYDIDTDGYWPLTYCLNDPYFEKMLPIRINCDCFVSKKEIEDA